MEMLKAATGRVILRGALLLEIPLAFCSAGFSGADVTIFPEAWTHNLHCYLDKNPSFVHSSSAKP